MIDTKVFKTRTIMFERENPSIDNIWTVALDIGYSSVKGFSPNSVFCFPSYAKENNFTRILDDLDDDYIEYEDENNQKWLVGSSAYKTLETNDISDNMKTLYGRNRYFSPMFLVIARVGLALAMQKNNFGDPENKEIKIQTGLPPKYENDATFLKEVLSGRHTFKIRFGSKGWQSFDFSIKEENIYSIPQPMGTLFSIVTDKDAGLTEDAKKILSSDTLIFDGGFGTLDIYKIKNSLIDEDACDTFDDLSMKKIFADTVKQIHKKTGVEVSVPAMQEVLDKGYVTSFDRRTRSTKNIPIAEILVKNSKKICDNALEEIDNAFDNLVKSDYLVVTGGTAQSWFEKIKAHYQNIEGLEVISGNRNDVLPNIFGNVRGYYMYLLRGLMKK